MQTNLAGVWDDGSAWALPEGKRPSSSMLRIPQGGSLRVVLTVMTPAGIAFDDASTFTLTVRKAPQAPKVLQLTGVKHAELGRGVWVFTATPAQTRSIEWGRHVFDVWGVRTEDSAREQVVKVSAAVVEVSNNL